MAEICKNIYINLHTNPPDYVDLPARQELNIWFHADNDHGVILLPTYFLR